VDILFGYLRVSEFTYLSYLSFISQKLQQESSKTSVVAKQISEQLSRDISAVVQQMASVLLDHEKYKQFLACAGTRAQQLLDLIQDVCRLTMMMPIELTMLPDS
jgi:hypothetical protein